MLDPSIYVCVCVWCVLCVCVWCVVFTYALVLPLCWFQGNHYFFIAFSGNCIFSLCLYPPPCFPPPLSPLHPRCFFSAILKGLTLLAPWWLLFHFILIKILRAFFNIPVWYYLNNLAPFLFPFVCFYACVYWWVCVCVSFSACYMFTSAQLSITSEQHIINMMIMNMCLNLFTFIYMKVIVFYSNHN